MQISGPVVTPEERDRLTRTEAKAEGLAEDNIEIKAAIKELKNETNSRLDTVQRDIKEVLGAVQQARGGWKTLALLIAVTSVLVEAAHWVWGVLLAGRTG